MNMFVGAATTAAAATAVRYLPHESIASQLASAIEAEEQAQYDRDMAQHACWRWEATDPWPSQTDGVTKAHWEWADRKEAYRMLVDIDGKEERLKIARERVSGLRSGLNG